MGFKPNFKKIMMKTLTYWLKTTNFLENEALTAKLDAFLQETFIAIQPTIFHLNQSDNTKVS